jgi:DinB superfamily
MVTTENDRDATGFCRLDKLQRKELIMTPAQPGLEVSAPSSYREKLLNLLAGRDPIEVLGKTASTLAEIVATQPAELLRGRAIQGKWTPNEIIGHLTDSEWVYGYRLRLILCEDEPPILGFSQDAWVASLRHNEREPSELVEIFRTLRGLNLSVWRRTSPEDLQRSGQHNERGAESLAAMLQLLAGHDLSHLHQISGYIQALESRG